MHQKYRLSIPCNGIARAGHGYTPPQKRLNAYETHSRALIPLGRGRNRAQSFVIARQQHLSASNVPELNGPCVHLPLKGESSVELADQFIVHLFEYLARLEARPVEALVHRENGDILPLFAMP